MLSILAIYDLATIFYWFLDATDVAVIRRTCTTAKHVMHDFVDKFEWESPCNLPRLLKFMVIRVFNLDTLANMMSDSTRAMLIAHLSTRNLINFGEDKLNMQGQFDCYPDMYNIIRLRYSCAVYSAKNGLLSGLPILKTIDKSPSVAYYLADHAMRPFKAYLLLRVLAIAVTYRQQEFLTQALLQYGVPLNIGYRRRCAHAIGTPATYRQHRFGSVAVRDIFVIAACVNNLPAIDHYLCFMRQPWNYMIWLGSVYAYIHGYGYEVYNFLQKRFPGIEKNVFEVLKEFPLSYNANQITTFEDAMTFDHPIVYNISSQILNLIADRHCIYELL